MAHITISEQERREYFVVGGTPSTGPFNFSFTFFDVDEIIVYEDGVLVDAADYTLTPNTDYEGGYNGGSITLDSTTVSVTMTIARESELTRDSDFPTSGVFNITTLNTTLDRIFVALQDLEDRTDRSLRLADSDETEALELPTPADRAGMLLGFSADGSEIVVTGIVPDSIVVTAAGEALITTASYAAMRTLLDLETGIDLQAYDADTLKADLTDNLAVGYTATTYNAGTKSTGTFTPDPQVGNLQLYINGGAHTLAPPTAGDCTMVLQVTNNASAGAVTTSGFTKKTGDTISTTNADDFLFFISKLNGFSNLHVLALQ